MCLINRITKRQNKILMVKQILLMSPVTQGDCLQQMTRAKPESICL